MSKLVKYWVVFVLSVVPFMAAEAREAPLVNFENQTVARADGKPISAEQVKKAIMLAGARHNWALTPDKSGHMTGVLNVRGKHSAVIDITYSATSFGIQYRDSINLRYRKDDTGVDMIHPNYNGWVDRLRAAIVTNIVTLQD